MLFTSYSFLLLAVALEVFGTMLLPVTQQFTKIAPSVGVIVCYSLSFYFLTLTLKTIPLAIVYASWSGIGIFAIACLSYTIYGQTLSWQAAFGMVLIVAGVVLINAYSLPKDSTS